MSDKKWKVGDPETKHHLNRVGEYARVEEYQCNRCSYRLKIDWDKESNKTVDLVEPDQDCPKDFHYWGEGFHVGVKSARFVK